jgi:predicted nucleotidyltransferase
MRNNLRKTRNHSAFASLFPAVRRQLLAATLTQPDKWWYLSELAHTLHTTPSSLQRELRTLVASGILQQRRDGTRTYFKAETRSPLFPELRGLVEKTAGLVPTVRQALEPFQKRIVCAFVYGSVARGREHPASDVDLLVIGDVGLADLAGPLRETERRLGREVNVISYSPQEFRTKAAAKDHFLSQVLRRPKQFVKGSQPDLDDVIGKSRRPAAPGLEKRTR